MPALSKIGILEDCAIYLEGEVGRYAHLLDEAEELDKHTLVARWTVQNSSALNRLGIRILSPFVRDYKFASVYQPFLHQVDTADFLVNHQKAFVFSSPGVGKTASAIWATDYLLSTQSIQRALVVCPLSIMKTAWLRDIFKCAPRLRAEIAHGSRKVRERVMLGGAEVCITNYDSVERIDKSHLDTFDLFIIDEANAYRKSNTNRFKFLNRYIKNRPDLRLWLMTGTPASQSPEDAYGLARLVCPDRVPKFFGQWRDMVMNKVTQFKYVPREDATDRVFEVLQPAIRYRKEDCLDLPPMSYQDREVPLSRQQREYYERIRKELLAETQAAVVTAVNAGVKLNKLLQISGGSVYADDGTILSFQVPDRLDELKSIVERAESKVIIFCNFKHSIGLVSESVSEWGYDTEIVHGGIGTTKRDRIFSDFQEKDSPHILVMQPQAVAHGLTLTAADTIIWWNPVFSLEVYDQANARIDRQSQIRNTNVYHFISSPVEAKVYQALRERKGVQSTLLSLYDSVVKTRVDDFEVDG